MSLPSENRHRWPNTAVKDAGRLLVAGKDYIVADGDIMHVRFAV